MDNKIRSLELRIKQEQDRLKSRNGVAMNCGYPREKAIARIKGWKKLLRELKK